MFRELSRKIVAVDLAQTFDFTAIVVSETVEGPDERLEHRVRHLQRLSRGTDYVTQVAEIKDLVDRVPGCALVVDQTGVGRPVVDMLNEAGLIPTAVTITAGESVTKVDYRNYRVPKRHLVTSLQIAVQAGRFKVAKDLRDAQHWADEMLAFQVEVSDRGHDTYGNDAALNAHDDLVIASAIGVWYAEEQARMQVQFF